MQNTSDNSASGPEGDVGRIEGRIDSLTRWGATGWAWIPADPDRVLQIEAMLNDNIIGSDVADRMRPDLVKRGKRSGRCSFSLVFEVPVYGDTVPVLHAVGPAGATVLSGSNWSNVSGHIDRLTPISAIGWAWMPAEPDRVLQVEAVLDDTVIARGLADLMRPDLASSGRGSGKYGFTLIFDEPVSGDAIPQVRVLGPGAPTVLSNPAKLESEGAQTSHKKDPFPSLLPAHADTEPTVDSAIRRLTRDVLVRGTTSTPRALVHQEPVVLPDSEGFCLVAERGNEMLDYSAETYIDTKPGSAASEAIQDASVVSDEYRAEPQRSTDLNLISQSGLFDFEFYLGRYPDIAQAGIPALEHFYNFGYLEGRQPNFYFDTAWYLRNNADVREAGLHPVVHYLHSGEVEGRKPSLCFDPLWYRKRNNIRDSDNALSHYLKNRKSCQVSPIQDFDVEHYARSYPDVVAAGIDPFEHYVTYGYREGRSPSANFDAAFYWARYLSGDRSQNPFLHFLAHKHESGVLGRMNDDEASIPREVKLPPRQLQSSKEGPDGEIRQQLIQIAYENAIARGDCVNLTIAKIKHARYENDDLNFVAEAFDYDYYANRYPDVAIAGLDGVVHYCSAGWREKRDPTPWFNTEYYLSTYPDIGSAGVNPFWHYIVAGRHEGRLPRGGDSAKRAVLNSLKPLDARTADYAIPDHVRITARKFETVLKKALLNANGLTVAVSHDCYRTVTGGIQIFVGDEQLKFNARGFVYVHLSPLRAALLVKDDAEEATETRIVVNGEIIGITSDADIADALQHLSPSLPEQRIFVVHSPLGHSVSGMARIQTALRSKQNFYWLHDYTAVCTGFQLLRNDVEYCGAPAIQSEACRICIYGGTRETNEKRLRSLFKHCDFTLVSPSETTRAIWLRASSLPHKGVLVVEHCHLSKVRDWLDVGDPAAVGTEARPVRVAFIGYPIMQKGWLTFERILDLVADYANYNFYHFASAESLRRRKNLRGVESNVTVDDRKLMTRRLRENEIDLVVIAAEWPETFSYVTFEALAAGADILTLNRSGNVAAVVRKTRRGRVLEHEDEIVEFFTSGKAIAYARARAQVGPYASELIHNGTTAALI